MSEKHKSISSSAIQVKNWWMNCWHMAYC